MSSYEYLRRTEPSPPFYMYTPLSSSDKFIRLLRIHRDPMTKTTSFSLVPIQCTPENPPTQAYDAIS